MTLWPFILQLCGLSSACLDVMQLLMFLTNCTCEAPLFCVSACVAVEMMLVQTVSHIHHIRVASLLCVLTSVVLDVLILQTVSHIHNTCVASLLCVLAYVALDWMSV